MRLGLSITYAVFFLLSSLAHAVPHEGQRMVIAGPSKLAADAGKKVAAKGGNVVDVAVAVELALAVTSPYYGGLGGGGFALIKMNNEVKALDFREMAPLATSPEFYKGKPAQASTDGGAAVATPGIPAGLWAMHKKYGKLHWSQLFDDAINLAQEGFEVSGEWARNTQNALPRMNQAGKDIFSKKGTPYKPGDKLEQKKLARLLKEMRNRGANAFYEGLAARDIVNTVEKTGGVLSLKDMKSYNVRWLSPLETTFNGYKIYLMPPPSSGGVVISTALKLMELKEIQKHAPLSVEELHLMAEILKMSFRGRSFLADPDFAKNPIAPLLSKGHIDSLSKMISESKASSPKNIDEKELLSLAEKSTETTHFSVLDNDGNSVAMTITLNGNYGSAVVSEQFGVALNNEMDDFTTRPGEPNQFGLVQGQANSVEPKKRPLSSMSPTLVEKDGRVILSLGSPGGPRIISAVLQVLYRVIGNSYGMDLAIRTPRVHHQFLPNELVVDENALPPETIKALEKKGHVIKFSPVAKVYGVYRNSKDLLEGAFDYRGEGGAAGF